MAQRVADIHSCSLTIVRHADVIRVCMIIHSQWSNFHFHFQARAEPQSHPIPNPEGQRRILGIKVPKEGHIAAIRQILPSLLCIGSSNAIYSSNFYRENRGIWAVPPTAPPPELSPLCLKYFCISHFLLYPSRPLGFPYHRRILSWLLTALTSPSCTPLLRIMPNPGASAAILLSKQYKLMQGDDSIQGISVGLVDNNVFEWEVMLMISDECKFYGGTAPFLSRRHHQTKARIWLPPAQTRN